MELVDGKVNTVGLKLADRFLNENDVATDDEDGAFTARPVQTVSLEIHEGAGKPGQFLEKLDRVIGGVGVDTKKVVSTVHFGLVGSASGPD